jgi:hypothetical protein
MMPPPDASVTLCPDGSVFDGGACPTPELFCDAGTMHVADGGCAPVGWTQCPTGFALEPGGWDCAPVTSATACPAGTMPLIGSPDCAPVGWTACPMGFTADPSGWGCAAILPAASCSGAARESIGSATCVPVGDCNAAFPPAGATLFVDDSFTAGQLDATHFARISDALTAAPAQATIAVDTGTYLETLAPSKAVKLVGRCAAQVTLKATVNQPALQVLSARGVEVSGFTIRDSLLGVRMETGGQLTLRASVLEANLRSGIQVLDGTTELTLEQVVIRGTLPDPATGTFGQGFAGSYGAQISMTDVAFVANRENGIFLDKPGTKATLTRVVIAGTLPRTSTGKLGWGIGMQGGAQLVLSQSVITGNQATGLAVVQAGTKATVTDSIVSDTKGGLDNVAAPIGFNVAVLLGATLDWTGGAMLRAAQTHVQIQASTAAIRGATLRTTLGGIAVPGGIVASQGTSLIIDHTAVIDSIGGALDALGANTQVTLDHVLLDGVLPNPLVPESGTGLRAQDQGSVGGSAVVVRRASAGGVIATNGGKLTLLDSIVAKTKDTPLPDAGEGGEGVIAQTNGSATVIRCLVEDNATAGLYTTGAGSRLSASQTVVRRTALNAAGEFGQGAVAEHGAALTLTDVALVANHSAGIQSAYVDTLMTVSRSTIRGTLPNATGTRGRGANIDFESALVAADTAFVDNQQVGLFTFMGKVELRQCLIGATRPDPDAKYGNGLEVLTDSKLTMIGGALEANQAIGAVFAEGAGVLDGVRVGKQVVGLHAQDGSQVEELAAAPAQLGARQVVVTPGTVFVGNATKFGGGSVPVPMP